MGFGEVAALYYLNSERERESKNADSLRTDYNNLANRFNDLLKESTRLENRVSELLDNVNLKASIIKELDIDHIRACDERNAARTEVSSLKQKIASQEGLITENADLKKQIASQQAFMLKQNDYVKDASDKNDTLLKMVATLREENKDITTENSFLEKQLVTKEHQLNQRKYLLEAIRRGVDEIPAEFRIKAAAKSYMRHPEVSQASIDRGMPEEMKKEIETLLTIAMFTEGGPKRFEVLDLYDTAKREIKEEMDASRKKVDKLLDIRAAMVQEAKDNGKDPDKVPDIWTIQSEMKNKSESEVLVSSQENDDDKMPRPRM